eukprot:GAHX01000414.1.p1 GENE.GAHX01000414.1~~GAHX01000414.1.p1  ORF type:complete len:51 (-),score=4.16 GAHX01000414.1:127-279(-)
MVFLLRSSAALQRTPEKIFGSLQSTSQNEALANSISTNKMRKMNKKRLDR